MNTITIDSGIYQFAANYAARRNVSVESIVESYLLGLRDKMRMDAHNVDGSESKVLSFEQLRPELQEILNLSAPLKGTVPEWDLNGDVARNDIITQ